MTLTSAQRRSMTWLALAVVAVLLLWLLSPVLSPFLISAVLAYALRPAVAWLVRCSTRRRSAPPFRRQNNLMTIASRIAPL